MQIGGVREKYPYKEFIVDTIITRRLIQMYHRSPHLARQVTRLEHCFTCSHVQHDIDFNERNMICLAFRRLSDTKNTPNRPLPLLSSVLVFGYTLHLAFVAEGPHAAMVKG